MVPGEEKGEIPISIIFSIEGNKNIFSDTHYSTELLTPQHQASGSITQKTQGEKAVKQLETWGRGVRCADELLTPKNKAAMFCTNATLTATRLHLAILPTTAAWNGSQLRTIDGFLESLCYPTSSVR